MKMLSLPCNSITYLPGYIYLYMSLVYLPTGYLTYEYIYQCFSSQDNARWAHLPA